MATQGPAPVNTGTVPVVIRPLDRSPAPVPPGPGTTGQIPTVTAPQGPPESAPPSVTPGPGTGQTTSTSTVTVVPVIEIPVDTGNTSGSGTSTPNITVPNLIEVLADGVIIIRDASALNFTGPGVTATANGAVATLTITSGSTYGNSNVGNLLSNYGSNTISTTGNITGGYLFGNGSQLTGIVTGYGNSNVVANLAALGSNPVSTTGNITGNYFIGNGSELTGIIAASASAPTSNVTGDLWFDTVNQQLKVWTGAAFLVVGPGYTSAQGTSGAIPETILNNVGATRYITSLYVNNVRVAIIYDGASFIPQASLQAAFPTIYPGMTLSASVSGSGFAGTLITAAQPNITSVGTLTSLSATGNITGNYFIGNGSQLTGLPATYGNSNVVANLAALGTNPVSTVGNITGGNLIASAVIVATVSASANITGNYILGNGSQLTGLPAAYGNANVVANLAALGTNPVSTIGNITGGYLFGNGSQLTGLPATYGNANVVANLAALGSNPVSTTGNVTGGNLLTGGLINATGNVTGGNLLAVNLVINNIRSDDSSFINIEDGVNVTGVIVASGNITGDYLFGNGSQLTGLPATYGNANVVANLAALGTNPVSTVGNITGGYILGNGSQLTGVNAVTVDVTDTNGLTTIYYPTFVENRTTAQIARADVNLTYRTDDNLLTVGNVSVTGNIDGGNLRTAGQISATGNITGGNIVTAGAVSAASVSSSGNVTGGNLITSAAVSAASVSASGNIIGGNVNTAAVNSTSTLTITTSSNGNINLQPNGTGNIILSNTYVNSVAYPVQDQDAASKIYVDNLVSTAISYHEAVVAATTTNLAATTGGTITYNQPNGAGNGIGATLTTTGSFNLIDTANVQTANTRILVKNEGNAVHNGIYVWSNATVITRSADTDTYGAGDAFALGLNDYFFVQSGNVNLSSSYIVDAPTGVITFGTSNIEFAQFSSSQTYTANTDAGLVLNSTVFSAKVDGVTTAFDGGGNIIVKASANLTTPNIGAATGSSLSVTGNITGGNILGGANVNATTHTGTTVSVTGNVTGGNANITSTTASTSKTTGALIVGGGVGIAGDLYVGPSLTVDNGAYGNVVTTQFASVWGHGAGPNPYSVMQVRASDGASGLGMQAFTGSGTLYGNTNIIFALGTIRDKDVPSNLVTKAYIDSTGLNVTGIVSASGNVTGGNLITAGAISAASVSASGNVTGGNLVTAGAVSAASVSASGNVTGGNILTGGLISSTGNITGGNILGGANVNATTHTGTTVSVTGNITGGNIVTAAAVSAASVSASGNITGGNINTGAQVVATGNITGGNLRSTSLSLSGNVISVLNASSSIAAGTTISAVGNITGGNVTTAGLTSTASLSITGNTATVTSANYSIGYLTIPQVTLSANATAGLTDIGKHFYSTTSGNLQITIPDNANVAFPVGTAISVVVQAAGNVLVVTQPSTTLYLSGNATSGNRVVGSYGMATIMKVASGTWFISGTGVS